VNSVDISYNVELSGNLHTSLYGTSALIPIETTSYTIKEGTYTIPSALPVTANINTFTKPYYLDLSSNGNKFIYDISKNNLSTNATYVLNIGYKPITDGTLLTPRLITRLKWIGSSASFQRNVTEYINVLSQTFKDDVKSVDDDNSTLFYNIDMSSNVVSDTLTQEITFAIDKVFNSDNFQVQFRDPSMNGATDINLNSWCVNLGVEQSYNLTNYKDKYYTIHSGNVKNNYIDFTSITNPQIRFSPKPNIRGLYVPNSTVNDIVIKLESSRYTRNSLFLTINQQFAANPITNGSQIYSLNTGTDYTRIFLNINKAYTAIDYNAVFYDIYSFSTCNNYIQNLQNVSWDDTLGWILGFRAHTVYPLATQSSYILSNAAASSFKNYGHSIIADTTFTNNFYNYFLIKLDDYTQSHLNDGLITISNSANLVDIPKYILNHNVVLNPIGEEEAFGVNENGKNQLTQNQIYAAQQTLDAKRKIQTNQVNYSKGPYVQDIFGFIPIKTSGISIGGTIIDSSGPLQNQQRVYFGPVNIRRMTITLLNDKGDVVDLNGSNWSFSLVCEQLYQQNTVK
jgi:hypothetical protein